MVTGLVVSRWLAHLPHSAGRQRASASAGLGFGLDFTTKVPYQAARAHVHNAPGVIDHRITLIELYRCINFHVASSKNLSLVETGDCHDLSLYSGSLRPHVNTATAARIQEPMVKGQAVPPDSAKRRHSLPLQRRPDRLTARWKLLRPGLVVIDPSDSTYFCPRLYLCYKMVWVTKNVKCWLLDYYELRENGVSP